MLRRNLKKGWPWLAVAVILKTVLSPGAFLETLLVTSTAMLMLYAIAYGFAFVIDTAVQRLRG